MPEMKLPIWSRILSGILGIFFTVVAGMWTGFKAFQGEIKTVKDEAIVEAKEGEKRVMNHISDIRLESNVVLRAQDAKFTVAVSGVQAQLNSMDSKLNILIRRSYSVNNKEADAYSFLEKKDETVFR